jgi:hypothetical protein
MPRGKTSSTTKKAKVIMEAPLKSAKRAIKTARKSSAKTATAAKHRMKTAASRIKRAAKKTSKTVQKKTAPKRRKRVSKTPVTGALSGAMTMLSKLSPF